MASSQVRAMLESLAASMENRDRIPVESAEKFLALMDQADNEALQLLVDRKVKFLWMPARRRLVDRGVIKS